MTNDYLPKQIQISFDENFELWSAERQASTLTAFAAILQTSPDNLEIHPINLEDNGFDLEVSSGIAERLYDLLQTNSGQLRLLGIKNVILERESGYVEEWMMQNGHFDLTLSVPPGSKSETNLPTHDFEPVPRIWLFHLIYLVVTILLAISILRFSMAVSLSLLFTSVICALGLVLARFGRFMAAHILAVAIGVGAPIVVFGRLFPTQTVILFLLLLASIFFFRRSLF